MGAYHSSCTDDELDLLATTNDEDEDELKELAKKCYPGKTVVAAKIFAQSSTFVEDPRYVRGGKRGGGKYQYRVGNITYDVDPNVIEEIIRKDPIIHNPTDTVKVTDVKSRQVFNIPKELVDLIIQQVTVTGGKKPVEKYKYKNRTYTVRTGTRGGRYIVVDNNKVYL